MDLSWGVLYELAYIIHYERIILDVSDLTIRLGISNDIKQYSVSIVHRLFDQLRLV